MKSSRYAKLVKELIELRESMVMSGVTLHPTSFNEIEQWAGISLPPSAYAHRAWWSNNDGNYSNTLKPWDLARLSTADVDMEARTLAFRLSGPDAEHAGKNRTPFDLKAFRSRLNRSAYDTNEESFSHSGMADVAQPYRAKERSTHPLRGALKGTVRITVDVDLTAPADPDWADRT